MSRTGRSRTYVRYNDADIRTIRTDEVRYPGFSHPSLEGDEYERWKAEGRQFRPARDTGLAVEGRMAREVRRRERERRRRNLAVIAGIVAFAALAMGWRYSSDRKAAEQPLDTLSAAARRASAPDPGVPQMRALDPAHDPTPYFASYKSLQLRLPVKTTDLTEVGFHQASYSYALHVKTPLEKADMSEVKKKKTSGRDLSKQETGPSAVLTGKVLTMWRSRPGKPDTAIDVGAKPGCPVIAPVTGTVVKVKKYKLYGKYTDYEIHIRPDGFPKVDCVMIHISDVRVEPGDRVEAGITRIGAVRELSNRETLQLGHYTKGGGDHTHLQLNDATHPDYEGLEGAIDVP